MQYRQAGGQRSSAMKWSRNGLPGCGASPARRPIPATDGTMRTPSDRMWPTGAGAAAGQGFARRAWLAGDPVGAGQP
ncbi:hypothetical protein BJP62_09810 [Jeongeupia sp. USM3]|nr:hypothetical protein BJP62_09810 [Jeongeupia sp. USM3]